MAVAESLKKASRSVVSRGGRSGIRGGGGEVDGRGGRGGREGSG